MAMGMRVWALLAVWACASTASAEFLKTGCSAPCQKPCTVTKTVMCPEWVTETKTIQCCETRQVEKTRIEKCTVKIPVVKEYSIKECYSEIEVRPVKYKTFETVPQETQHEGLQTRCVCETQTRMVEKLVCKPGCCTPEKVQVEECFTKCCEKTFLVPVTVRRLVEVPVEKETTTQVLVQKTRLKPVKEVVGWQCQEVDKEVKYTVCEKVMVDKQIEVKVCKMVPKQIEVPCCSRCCQ